MLIPNILLYHIYCLLHIKNVTCYMIKYVCTWVFVIKMQRSGVNAVSNIVVSSHTECSAASLYILTACKYINKSRIVMIMHVQRFQRAPTQTNASVENVKLHYGRNKADFSRLFSTSVFIMFLPLIKKF